MRLPARVSCSPPLLCVRGAATPHFLHRRLHELLVLKFFAPADGVSSLPAPPQARAPVWGRGTPWARAPTFFPGLSPGWVSFPCTRRIPQLRAVFLNSQEGGPHRGPRAPLTGHGGSHPRAGALNRKERSPPAGRRPQLGIQGSCACCATAQENSKTGTLNCGPGILTGTHRGPTYVSCALNCAYSGPTTGLCALGPAR